MESLHKWDQVKVTKLKCNLHDGTVRFLQYAQDPATKPDDLSFILKSYMVEGDNQFSKTVI